MTSPPRKLGSPDAPEARALWLHEVGGFSPEEIGWRLGVPLEQVEALLAQGGPEPVAARATGQSKELARQLRHLLMERYRLDALTLAAPRAGETALEAVAQAGALIVARVLRAATDGQVIGFSHGRTIIRMIEALPPMRLARLRFVSLLGELTASGAAYPYVAMHRLTEKFGCDAYPMPVPLYAQDPEDAARYHALSVVAAGRELAPEAVLWILGVGMPTEESQLISTSMLGAPDVRALAGKGAVSEVLGRFYAADGQEVGTDLAERTMAPILSPFETVAPRRVLALAAGVEKADSLRAALQGRLFGELVTDIETAVHLLPEEERSPFERFLKGENATGA